MTPKIKQDVWVLLGLAAAGYLCALGVHKQLIAVRKTAEVTREENLTQDKINQRTQNAIKLDTLGHLLQSASPEIRWASAKILSERNIQSADVWKILRRDIACKDFKKRDRALTSLNFLTSYFRQSLHEDPHFRHDDTFKAIVSCLCNMLPAACEAESSGQHHAPAEADALWIMQQLLEISVNAALRAGLISKWLAHYPLQIKWPKKEKSEIVHDMIRDFEYNDDYERFLCCILREISQFRIARNEMKQYGVGDPGPFDMGSNFADDSRWMARRDQPLSFVGPVDDTTAESEEEGIFIMEDIGANSPIEYGGPAGAMRRREESLEERSLRRRRREAMVYAENGRPIQRGDIIEREYVIRDEEIEEELEQLIEEVAEAEGAEEQGGTWLRWLSRVRPDGLVHP